MVWCGQKREGGGGNGWSTEMGGFAAGRRRSSLFAGFKVRRLARFPSSSSSLPTLYPCSSPFVAEDI